MSEEKNKLVAQETSVGFIKGLFGAVPFVGTLPTEAVFDIRARIKQRRFEEFTLKLTNRIENLENKINYNFLKSEEFIDLFEDMTEKILRNKSQKKLNIFTDILASSMCKSALDDIEFSHLYISIIDSLTEVELKILDSLYKYAVAAEKKMKDQNVELEMMAIDYSQENIWNVPKLDFKICFETLISKGLAFDDSSGHWDTKPRTFIKPTPLAIALIDFIIKSQSELNNSEKS